jgi:hypothetical protein
VRARPACGDCRTGTGADARINIDDVPRYQRRLRQPVPLHEHHRRSPHLRTARKAFGAYIHGYYNVDRRHSTIGGVSPFDFEEQHRAIRAVAA